MTRPSTRAVGDAFEAFSARFLNTDLRMSLRVVGGKSDGGVDLRGDWWLPLRLVSRPLQDYSVHLPTQQRAPVPRGYGYPTHHARRLAQLHADALLKAEFVKIVATAAPEPKFEHLVAKVALIAEEADDEYMDFALNHPYMATPSVTTSDDPPPPTFIEPPGLIEKDGHLLPNPFEISPVRVVGQCKAEAKATGPKHIRELEGVLDALSKPRYEIPLEGETLQPLRDNVPKGVVGVFVSQSGFTPGSLKHASASQQPLMLVHLDGGRVDDELVHLDSRRPDPNQEHLAPGCTDVVSMWWNAPFNRILAAHDMSIRLETMDAPAASRAGIYYGDRRMARYGPPPPW